MNETKEFDCIEMKRRSALRLHEQMDGMTQEEKVAFLAERSRIAMERLAKLHQAAVEQPRIAG